MSDDMVERISKVLCPEPPDGTDRRVGDDGTPYPAGVPHWMAHAEKAREIVAAMREPTEAMEIKGLDALYKDVYPGDSVNMAEAYTAMIDAALNSKS